MWVFFARSSSEGAPKSEEADVSPEEPQRCTAALSIGGLGLGGFGFRVLGLETMLMRLWIFRVQDLGSSGYAVSRRKTIVGTPTRDP